MKYKERSKVRQREGIKKRERAVVVAQFGRVVASNNRGLRFESSHRQNFYIKHLYTANCIETHKNKRPVMVDFKRERERENERQKER